MDVRYILLSERERQSETGRENNNARWLECRVKQLNNHRKPYISIIFTSCCITGVQNAKLINLHEKNLSNLSDLILHMHALCRNLVPLENTDEKKNTKILKGENLREIEKDGFGEKSKEDWSKKEGERRYNCCLCYKNNFHSNKSVSIKSSLPYMLLPPLNQVSFFCLCLIIWLLLTSYGLRSIYNSSPPWQLFPMTIWPFSQMFLASCSLRLAQYWTIYLSYLSVWLNIQIWGDMDTGHDLCVNIQNGYKIIFCQSFLTYYYT